MNRRKFLFSTALTSSALLLPSLAQAKKTANDIVVGQSVDLSGPLQNLGRDYFTGAKIAFDEANLKGGTLGKRWRFIQLDDGANTEIAVANTARLLNKDKADILFGFTGDDCVEAVLGSTAFKSSEQILFAPMSGISRHKDEGRAVYLRATYAEEVAAMFRQFFSGNMSSFAMVTAPTATGMAIQNSALALMNKQDLPAPTLLTLKEDASNAAALAAKIASIRPHAIVILTDTIAAALLTRELRQRAPGLTIGVTSNADPIALQQLIGAEFASGLVITRVVPNPHKGTQRIVREFSRVLAKYLDEPATAASLEGYIAARALIETVRGTGGSTLSLKPTRIIDLGDWTLRFDNGERASRYVDTSALTRKGTLLG